MMQEPAGRTPQGPPAPTILPGQEGVLQESLQPIQQGPYPPLILGGQPRMPSLDLPPMGEDSPPALGLIEDPQRQPPPAMPPLQLPEQLPQDPAAASQLLEMIPLYLKNELQRRDYAQQSEIAKGINEGPGKAQGLQQRMMLEPDDEGIDQEIEDQSPFVAKSTTEKFKASRRRRKVLKSEMESFDKDLEEQLRSTFGASVVKRGAEDRTREIQGEIAALDRATWDYAMKNNGRMDPAMDERRKRKAELEEELRVPGAGRLELSDLGRGLASPFTNETSVEESMLAKSRRMIDERLAPYTTSEDGDVSGAFREWSAGIRKKLPDGVTPAMMRSALAEQAARTVARVKGATAGKDFVSQAVGVLPWFLEGAGEIAAAGKVAKGLLEGSKLAQSSPRIARAAETAITYVAGPAMAQGAIAAVQPLMPSAQNQIDQIEDPKLKEATEGAYRVLQVTQQTALGAMFSMSDVLRVSGAGGSLGKMAQRYVEKSTLGKTIGSGLAIAAAAPALTEVANMGVEKASEMLRSGEVTPSDVLADMAMAKNPALVGPVRRLAQAKTWEEAKEAATEYALQAAPMAVGIGTIHALSFAGAKIGSRKAMLDLNRAAEKDVADMVEKGLDPEVAKVVVQKLRQETEQMAPGHAEDDRAATTARAEEALGGPGPVDAKVMAENAAKELLPGVGTVRQRLAAAVEAHDANPDDLQAQHALEVAMHLSRAADAKDPEEAALAIAQARRTPKREPMEAGEIDAPEDGLDALDRQLADWEGEGGRPEPIDDEALQVRLAHDETKNVRPQEHDDALRSVADEATRDWEIVGRDPDSGDFTLRSLDNESRVTVPERDLARYRIADQEPTETGPRLRQWGDARKNKNPDLIDRLPKLDLQDFLDNYPGDAREILKEAQRRGLVEPRPENRRGPRIKKGGKIKEEIAASVGKEKNYLFVRRSKDGKRSGMSWDHAAEAMHSGGFLKGEFAEAGVEAVDAFHDAFWDRGTVLSRTETPESAMLEMEREHNTPLLRQAADEQGWAPKSAATVDDLYYEAASNARGGILTVADMARDLGIGRKRATQIFKEMEGEGLIRKTGRKWELNPEHESAGRDDPHTISEERQVDMEKIGAKIEGLIRGIADEFEDSGGDTKIAGSKAELATLLTDFGDVARPDDPEAGSAAMAAQMLHLLPEHLQTDEFITDVMGFPKTAIELVRAAGADPAVLEAKTKLADTSFDFAGEGASYVSESGEKPTLRTMTDRVRSSFDEAIAAGQTEHEAAETAYAKWSEDDHNLTVPTHREFVEGERKVLDADLRQLQKPKHQAEALSGIAERIRDLELQSEGTALLSMTPEGRAIVDRLNKLKQAMLVDGAIPGELLQPLGGGSAAEGRRHVERVTMSGPRRGWSRDDFNPLAIADGLPNPREIQRLGEQLRDMIVGNARLIGEGGGEHAEAVRANQVYNELQAALATLGWSMKDGDRKAAVKSYSDQVRRSFEGRFGDILDADLIRKAKSYLASAGPNAGFVDSMREQQRAAEERMAKRSSRRTPNQSGHLFVPNYLGAGYQMLVSGAKRAMLWLQIARTSMAKLFHRFWSGFRTGKAVAGKMWLGPTALVRGAKSILGKERRQKWDLGNLLSRTDTVAQDLSGELMGGRDRGANSFSGIVDNLSKWRESSAVLMVEKASRGKAVAEELFNRATKLFPEDSASDAAAARWLEAGTEEQRAAIGKDMTDEQRQVLGAFQTFWKTTRDLAARRLLPDQLIRENEYLPHLNAVYERLQTARDEVNTRYWEAVAERNKHPKPKKGKEPTPERREAERLVRQLERARKKYNDQMDDTAAEVAKIHSELDQIGREWGIENYTPHVLNTDPHQPVGWDGGVMVMPDPRELLGKLHAVEGDLLEVARDWVPQTVPARLRSKHWMKRKNAGESVKRDVSYVRSMFHYLRELYRLAPASSWYEQNRERLFGKMRVLENAEIDAGSVTRMDTAEKGYKSRRVRWVDTGRGKSVRADQLFQLGGKVFTLTLQGPDGATKDVHFRTAGDLMRAREFGVDTFGLDKSEWSIAEDQKYGHRIVLLPDKSTTASPDQRIRTTEQRLQDKRPPEVDEEGNPVDMDEITMGEPDPVTKQLTLPTHAQLFWPSQVYGRLSTTEPGKIHHILRDSGPESAKAFAKYIQDDVLGSATGKHILTVAQNITATVATAVRHKVLGLVNPGTAIKEMVDTTMANATWVGADNAWEAASWSMEFSARLHRGIEDIDHAGLSTWLEQHTLRDVGDGQVGVLPPALLEAVKTPEAKLAAMSPKKRAEREMQDEAFQQFLGSSLSGGSVMAMFTPTEKRYRYGQKIGVDWGKATSILRGAGRAADKMSWFLRGRAQDHTMHQTWFAGYMIARRGGLSMEEATHQANLYALSNSIVANRASMAPMLNTAAGNVARPMMSWVIGQSSVNWRYLFHQSPKGQAETRAGLHGPAGWERIAKLGAVGAVRAGTKLASTFASMYLLQQMGMLFGYDFTRSIGQGFTEMPIVGNWGVWTSHELQAKMGLAATPEDAYQELPPWRQKLVDQAKEHAPEWMREWAIRQAQRAGSMPADVPIFPLWGNWTPYAAETAKSWLDLFKAEMIDGDVKKARNLWHRNLTGSLWMVRLAEQVYGTELDPSDPNFGLVRNRATGVTNTRREIGNWLRVAYNMIGSSMDDSIDRIERQVLGPMRTAREAASTRNASFLAGELYQASTKARLESQHAEDPGIKAKLDQIATGKAHEFMEATKAYAREHEMSTNETKALVKRWRQVADRNYLLTSSERDIVNAYSSDMAFRLMANELNKVPYVDKPAMTKARWQVVQGLWFKDADAMRESLKGTSKDTREKFLRSLRTAKQRWTMQDQAEAAGIR